MVKGRSIKADPVCVTESQDLIALYYVLSDEFSSHFQNLHERREKFPKWELGNQESEDREPVVRELVFIRDNM